MALHEIQGVHVRCDAEGAFLVHQENGASQFMQRTGFPALQENLPAVAAPDFFDGGPYRSHNLDVPKPAFLLLQGVQSRFQDGQVFFSLLPMERGEM